MTRRKTGNEKQPLYLPTPAQIREGCRLARLARGEPPVVGDDDETSEFDDEVVADRAARRMKR